MEITLLEYVVFVFFLGGEQSQMDTGSNIYLTYLKHSSCCRLVI